MFSDFFDEIIYHRHNKYAASAKHVTDLNPNNLVGGNNLDPNYVLSCRVRTGRSIRGYALPPVCTRAERKAVERILANALGKLDGKFKGMMDEYKCVTKGKHYKTTQIFPSAYCIR